MIIPEIHNDAEALTLCQHCHDQLEQLLAAEPAHTEYATIAHQLDWVKKFILHPDQCDLSYKQTLLFGFYAMRTKEHFDPHLSLALSQLACYIDQHPHG